MAKRSAYLQRRDAELEAAFNAGAAMALQFATDTLQITIHQKDGWGYDPDPFPGSLPAREKNQIREVRYG